MATTQSIIAELEDAIRDGSPDQRVETLRRATDLFLSEAERLTEAQIALFDDVFVHLIREIEIKAKAVLSRRLAPVDRAPAGAIRQLACDDAITVAEPVLRHSARLSENDLLEFARNKSQQHLLAISGRTTLTEPVTDLLVSRGNGEVKRKLASNPGAKLSESGFTSLVDSAGNDESLVEKIGLRIDLPHRLLHRLLLKATAAARARILALAPAETRDVIQETLSKISGEMYREIAPKRDFSKAIEKINQMQKEGSLNETSILAFANARSYEETVAALGALCSTSLEFIEPLVTGIDGLLVACKAAKLNWPTANALLESWILRHQVTEPELAKAKQDYQKLSEASAQRTLGFWKARMETSPNFSLSCS